MRLASNLIGLKTRSGPAYERWRRGLLARLGIVVMDEQRERG